MSEDSTKAKPDLVEILIGCGFIVGIFLGAVFACKNQVEISRLTSVSPTEVRQILDAAPTVAGTVAIISALLIALRTAAATQTKRVSLLDKNSPKAKEDIAGADAWNDVELIGTFLSFGFLFGVVFKSWTGERWVALSALIAIICLLVPYFLLKRYHLNRNRKIASVNAGTGTKAPTKLEAECSSSKDVTEITPPQAPEHTL